MKLLLKHIKIFAAILDGRRHILISYANGDCDLFPVSHDDELSQLMDFLEESNFNAIAILLSTRGKMMINFEQVRSIEIIE